MMVSPEETEVKDPEAESSTDEVVKTIEIPPEAFELLGDDDSGLAVPDEVMTELMAGQLVEYLKSFHNSDAAGRAARQQGDDVRVKQFDKDKAFCRSAAAWLMYKFKGTKEIADHMMSMAAIRAQEARKSDSFGPAPQATTP